jgi:hypothetical protein
VSFVVCRTCAVEHSAPVAVCRICSDELQWVPAKGQAWTTLDEMAATGFRTRMAELEPGLFEITSTPNAGIGQHTKLVQTDAGNLLWDPIGYLDRDGVARVRDLGPVAAIVASHPHMFGVQVAWGHALGGVPVSVCEPNLEWVARHDPLIAPWSGSLEPIPGVRLVWWCDTEMAWHLRRAMTHRDAASSTPRIFPICRMIVVLASLGLAGRMRNAIFRVTPLR